VSKNEGLSDHVLARIDRLVEVATEQNAERRRRSLARVAAAAMPKETKLVPEIRRERGEIDFVIREFALVDSNGKPTGRTQPRAVVVVRSRLEQMERRGEITRRQRIAGDRLERAFQQAQVAIRSALDLDRVRGAGNDGAMAVYETAGNIAGATMEIERAISALGSLAHVVLYVAVAGLPASQWAEASGYNGRSGIDMLKLGLSTLANHYRLDGD